MSTRKVVHLASFLKVKFFGTSEGSGLFLESDFIAFINILLIKKNSLGNSFVRMQIDPFQLSE